MVRVRCGKREAILRVSEGRVIICGRDGRPVLFTDSHKSAADAILWLADRWKLKTMFCCESDDEDSWLPVYGEERIISDVPGVGDLTPQQELDWLMFNTGSIVYNTADERLWKVSLSAYPKTTPPHRRIYTEEWSVPQYPDRFYEAFARSITEEFPNVTVSTRDQLGHYKVAQLVRETVVISFPSVEILMDSDLGYHRVTKVNAEHVRVNYEPYADFVAIEKRVGLIRSKCEEQLLASWKSLFSDKWDVAELSKNAFYNHTFAGHCYQTENFIGMKSVPSGFAIAWENRYDDIILLRVRSDGTVRCPPELKGKIIGTRGGNIKRVAHLLNKFHWEIKIV